MIKGPPSMWGGNRKTERGRPDWRGFGESSKQGERDPPGGGSIKG